MTLILMALALLALLYFLLPPRPMGLECADCTASGLRRLCACSCGATPCEECMKIHLHVGHRSLACEALLGP